MKRIILTISSMLLFIILQAQVKPDVINTSGMSAHYAGGYLARSVGEPVTGNITATNAWICPISAVVLAATPVRTTHFMFVWLVIFNVIM